MVDAVLLVGVEHLVVTSWPSRILGSNQTSHLLATSYLDCLTVSRLRYLRHCKNGSSCSTCCRYLSLFILERQRPWQKPDCRLWFASDCSILLDILYFGLDSWHSCFAIPLLGLIAVVQYLLRPSRFWNLCSLHASLFSRVTLFAWLLSLHETVLNSRSDLRARVFPIVSPQGYS